MGKRKRRADLKKTPHLPPPDHSSQVDSLAEQKSSDQVDGSDVKPSSVIMDGVDNSVEVLPGEQSPVHTQHNCSRAVLLKHHQRYYNRRYSRRSSCNHGEASASHGKGTSPQDEKLDLKLSSRQNPEFERHTEHWDRALCRPEKIRHSLLAKDVTSSDAMRILCGICNKLLRKKPYVLDNTTSSSELSVVAVLVCGHAYHADCLEQRTCHENQQDPPCPSCAGLLSEGDASLVQE